LEEAPKPAHWELHCNWNSLVVDRVFVHSLEYVRQTQLVIVVDLIGDSFDAVVLLLFVILDYEGQ
jgi:hypothetical protein